jgi:hypothetical protein
MLKYLLPHTICNDVSADITLPLNSSLTTYLTMLSYQHECVDASSIIQYITLSHCAHLMCTHVTDIDTSLQYKVLIDHSDHPSMESLHYLEKNGFFIVKIIDSTQPEFIQLLYKL